MFINKNKLKIFAIVLALLFIVPNLKIEASRIPSIYANMSRVASNVNSSVAIYFSLIDGVPAAGSITITIPSAFTFGSLYDYNDVTLEEGSSSVCATASFTGKTLGSTPSGATWGVSKTGSTTITFTSGTGSITANRCVKVQLNSNGTNHTLTNPNVTSNTVYNITVDTPTENGQLSVIILGDASASNVDQVSLVAKVSTSILMGIDTVLSNCNNTTQTTPSNQSINFGTLYPGTAVISGSDVPFVCIEAGTNSVNGLKILVQSSRVNTIGGLVSSSGVIASSTANLNLVGTSTGYGLRVASLGTTSLGSFTANVPFNSITAGDIGQVSGSSGTATQIINASGVVRSQNNARIAIELGAKSSTSTPADEYSDVLTFTAFTNL